MKRAVLAIIVIALCAMPIVVSAAESVEAQISRQKAEAINRICKSYEPKGSFQSTTTFPPGHPADAVFGTFDRFDDQFNIYIWRENNAVWIEIEPLAAEVFICSSSFFIFQNNTLFNSVRLETIYDNSQCGDLPLTAVFKLAQWSFVTNPANLDNAFALFYDGGGDICRRIDIPAASGGSTTQPETPEPDECFTQTDIDAAYENGIQACIDDPASYGIEVSGGCSQTDLDAQYQAGLAACGDGGGEPATLTGDLQNLHIPMLRYNTAFGDMDLWVDFKYAPSDGRFLFEVEDFGTIE